MTRPSLYRGVWPQNVSSLAKYAVRYVAGGWKVTVLYDAGDGLRYLAVEGGQEALADRVNTIKRACGDEIGGPFYINEYRHVIVPVRDATDSGAGSLYYFADWLEDDLVFEYEGRPLTTRPVTEGGAPLAPGTRWVGPRPGIPYVLKAGAVDIQYSTPALTDSEPPRVLTRTTRTVQLSRIVKDTSARASLVRQIAAVKGHRGGRFYLNEHGAIFAPMGAGDGNGLDYIYCGQVDLKSWYPEPSVEVWEP
jgi:hypothetical protein